MEIYKEVTIKLSKEDLELIIIDHLKLNGIDVKSVNFSVNGHDMEGDFRSEYPLVYRLDEVICKGVESKI